MGNLNADDLNLLEHFQKASVKYENEVIEYLDLCLKDYLTDPQADRLDSILAQAEQDELMSFWLDEVDHIVAHELGLIDSNFVAEQQNALRKKIRNFPDTKVLIKRLKSSMKQAKSVVSYCYDRSTDREFVELLQGTLKDEGVYNGKIDGQFGSSTQEALKKLEQS